MKKIVTIIVMFGLLAATSVYNADYVHESLTMLLSGGALIGFAAVGRKRLFKKG